ncbi:MAG: hypothetical protein CMC23_05340 [Flavobacteriaceae bacterium]|nr:hypothetical protein [Flavobacteriaceae bacterium]|tara:strand:- start:15759 stop:16586 length:828 start_codon:yes stop_codon:yes gene_type:complete
MQDKPKNLIRYKIRNFLFDYFRKKDYIINNYSGDTNLRNFFNSIKPIDIQEGLIRIGGNNDGGYLVPNVLEGIKYCFSPGVDDNVSFEKELSENYSIKSFMCDLSISSLPIEDPSFKFLKKNLNIYNNKENITFEDWFNDSVSENSGESILQMDIEGYEYKVLYDIPHKILSNFKILVVEFHEFSKFLFEPVGYHFVSGVFEKILSEFSVVHIHENNCCPSTTMKGIRIPKVVEMTFLNKKYINPTGKDASIPHPLDEKNVPSQPDSYFPKLWDK